MSLRTQIGIYLARSASYLTRALHQGGGSALPGLILHTISPRALKEIAPQKIHRAICVSGTNGKTTTSQLIVEGLQSSGQTLIHNRNGSNLERGLLSALISAPSSAPQQTIGVFECDEAALLTILPAIQPDTLVLTNLFRDQLDRYGEIETTRKKWSTLLAQINWPIQIIYNAADPQLHYLLTTQKNEQLTSKPMLLTNLIPQLPVHSVLNPLTHIHCPQCTNQLIFTDEILIGQGSFHCLVCQFSNKTITTISIDSISYNTINLHLALQVTSSAPLLTKIFGRRETIQVANQSWQIILIKNPNGAYQAIKETSHQPNNHIIFALNDHFADGTDVSWIWDIPLEELSLPTDSVYYTIGTRKADMALRLKYLDLHAPPLDSWQQLLDQQSQHATIYCTYTAMLDLQNWLAKSGYKKDYWK